MDKRRELMKQAVHFFSMKGFHQTSVQEIAQASGISKGAFYKHFDSKESLFIEIIKQHHEEIISETSAIHFLEHLDPLEVFNRKIAIEIERVLDNHEFFLMVFKDFPPSESEQIAALFQELQTSAMASHKKSILEAFGSKVEPFLLDLATVLGGMLREYFITLIFESKQVSPIKLSAFITGSIHAIVQQLDELDPVLSEEQTFIDQRNELLKGIEDKIQRLSSENDRLLPSFELLKKELGKKEPKIFLVEALLVYLKQEQQLEHDVNRLEKLI
ncbi:TetR/AcrR family transcriptional regulator [Planomicrobium sp. CPCC 101079]|uniref:TetR/AcrR family transcriptional regulator n=1 Tax=Planomicrobium sp. CPCC 101079 TaxID=2599618 RepID=UPI0011B5F155|nr:TetR/AcrR family transcriptional regulator [Planomicrobium sp. CPCC 101079]TWT04958.1 TetR/AcrR family transcriptional regulator [Planomicrobium sp. CPCC 101079]